MTVTYHEKSPNIDIMLICFVSFMLSVAPVLLHSEQACSVFSRETKMPKNDKHVKESYL